MTSENQLWKALGQWGEDVARVEPLAGGVANDVWSVRIDGRLAVGRLGTRSDADLAWETGLLNHLDGNGLTVPAPIPTTDGRLFADGLVVMTYVEGGPPETEADWRRVADTLRRLHRLTPGWPQRPGWRSSTDLLHAETGTKIDLGAMPPEGVARCRAAWARLVGRQPCVVHGDPNNLGNVRMTAERVALIDWDEAHVDVPDLDLVLPDNAAGLDDGAAKPPDRLRGNRDGYRAWDCEADTSGAAMAELMGIARFKLNEGKLEEYKRLSAQAMEIVRTKEPGTLQYDTYFNEDQSECVIVERYRDSEAAMEHAANLADISAAVLETVSVVHGELLGEPSAELRAKLAGIEVPQLFTPYESM